MNRDRLLDAYRGARDRTIALAAPLSVEDQCLQSMPDASPTKWHLGHTTWFFETFILAEHEPGYVAFDPGFAVLFNSYYNGVGDQFDRPSRGLLSRPSLERVLRYRESIDDRITALWSVADDRLADPLATLLELGVHHEQQHQELLLTDIKHALSHNPLDPAYDARSRPPRAQPPAPTWRSLAPGIQTIGHQESGFSFDNETPAHEVQLCGAVIRDTPVSNHEWLEFMNDGGYDNPLLWLSDGWAWRQQTRTDAPLYWRRESDGWTQFTLNGRLPIDPHDPVCHINYYEAEAFARWAGARLPTEAEWEAAARQWPQSSNTPVSFDARHEFDRTWQWTGSAYLPYPGFCPAAGAVGEYNGKFMVNQMVLRGASSATPPGHDRVSYRNFFPPSARWQYTGLGLARDV